MLGGRDLVELPKEEAANFLLNTMAIPTMLVHMTARAKPGVQQVLIALKTSDVIVVARGKPTLHISSYRIRMRNDG